MKCTCTHAHTHTRTHGHTHTHTHRHTHTHTHRHTHTHARTHTHTDTDTDRVAHSLCDAVIWWAGRDILIVFLWPNCDLWAGWREWRLPAVPALWETEVGISIFMRSTILLIASQFL